MGENLVKSIQSDYDYDCVGGPLRYRGQESFINFYSYKDSQDQ